MWKRLWAVCRRLVGPWRALDAPGVRGESLAEKHLVGLGYRVIGRNLACRIGEIDLLAQTPDGRIAVVVEVKTREVDPDQPGTRDRRTRPEARVGRRKQAKLAALADWAVKRYGLRDKPVRFDVIGVDLWKDGRTEVRHHVGAFESPY